MKPMSLYASSDIERLGRVLGRDEAMGLGRWLLELVQDHSTGVFLEHTSRALITIRNGQLSDWYVGDELGVWFASQFGSSWPLWISTNQSDAVSLTRVIEQARQMLPPSPETQPRENPDDPKYFTLNPREFLPVSLWRDETARMIDAPQQDRIAEMVRVAPDRQDIESIGSLVVSARSTLYMYEPGLTAWAQETDSELTWSAYTPDGRASAWAGQASRDIRELSPQVVATNVGDLLDQCRDPVGVEPGRRTAILGPAAVAQWVRFMAESFAGGQPNSPFAEHLDDGTVRSRVGQQVFDERLRMVSDPADPEGGFPPFFEYGNHGAYKTVGLPIPAMTWIDGGVLQELSWGIKAYGRPWCELPYSVRLEAMPGTSVMTLDEMIASCEDGIYVNRFGGVGVIERRSGMMTGVTRDGCFLIRDGKISKPVKNFRFVESPFHAFNRILAIGPAQRVALGMQDPTRSEQSAVNDWPPQGRWTRWPRLPIIVPPLMITDFNFSALAEAV